MPYVKQEQRKAIDPAVDALVVAIEKATTEAWPADKREEPDGCLNYAITTLLQKTIAPNRYVKFERVIGILECAKLEMYRRGVAPYENKKAREHGDVFDWVEGGQLDAH